MVACHANSSMLHKCQGHVKLIQQVITKHTKDVRNEGRKINDI